MISDCLAPFYLETQARRGWVERWDDWWFYPLNPVGCGVMPVCTGLDDLPIAHDY